MTTHKTLSRDMLNDFVDPGDAILNLTSEAVAGHIWTVRLEPDGRPLLRQGSAWPVPKIPEAAALATVLNGEVTRLVIISDGSRQVCQLTRDLDLHHVPHVVCVLEETCDADAFMDQEDSEAVAERLRQLGYI